MVGKKSKAMLTESERDNLVDKIDKAVQNNRHFIVIIDEAHKMIQQKHVILFHDLMHQKRYVYRQR